MMAAGRSRGRIHTLRADYSSVARCAEGMGMLQAESGF
jgi:hypothetical protein